MSNAKSILGERLAKGEITEEEYERLASKLGDGTTTGSAPQSPAPGGSFLSGNPKIAGMAKGLGVFALLVLVYGIYPAQSKSGTLREARAACDSQRFNCECVVRKIDERFSLVHYMPLIGSMVRPSDEDRKAIITQFFKDCG